MLWSLGLTTAKFRKLQEYQRWGYTLLSRKDKYDWIWNQAIREEWKVQDAVNWGWLIDILQPAHLQNTRHNCQREGSRHWRDHQNNGDPVGHLRSKKIITSKTQVVALMWNEEKNFKAWKTLFITYLLILSNPLYSVNSFELIFLFPVYANMLISSCLIFFSEPLCPYCSSVHLCPYAILMFVFIC